ncbi:hypothetical protein K4F52_009618 [Lecanicillium sp. MT-2017a]|nr:hypothetical protein K4F52_009618 [Lecanicillium sp. MT-2017a]
MSSAPVKKPRTGASPPRRFEIPASAAAPLTAAGVRSPREAVFSPLFFSNRPVRHNRPSLDSTSDLAASMLSRGSDPSHESVTTLKLPRACVSSASPALSGSTPGSLSSSIDVSASSISPDSVTLPSNLQVLRSIGVLELLEDDDRPTFMVDLNNPANAIQPNLPILYYNASLRAFQEIHHLFMSESPDGRAAPPTAEYQTFKAWVLSTATDPQRPELTLPSCDYGHITWTRSTVRQRFRFISGNINLSSSTGSVYSSPKTSLVDEPESVDVDLATATLPAPVEPAADSLEPIDYFGDAVSETSKPVSSAEQLRFERALSTQAGPGHPDEFTNQVLQSKEARPFFDWTRIPMSDSLPEHIKLAKATDWASTPLGPIEDWSYELRALSNLVMGSPHPATLYWGPDYICIYNAAYTEIASKRHPEIMGMKNMEAWPELVDDIEPVFRSAWESGQATMKHDNQLFLNRDGYLEETFFSWSLVPVIGGDGQVVGLYSPAFENTRRKINERRMLTLREIGERTATATTVSCFWQLVQKGLDYNELDIPFSLIYSLTEESNSEVGSTQSGGVNQPVHLTLEASAGVPRDHPSAPEILDLRTSDAGFAPYMRQSMALGGTPVVLSREDETLPDHLTDGFQWRGFGEPCRTIVIYPIVPTTSGETITDFIILGVNPRRPYDDDYKLFLHLLARQLATSMASVVLFEEEIKRGQRAAKLAAMDRQELSMQLLLRTQEQSELERRFTRMAENAPVGMFIADSNGIIDYCNDMWWQISRHVRSEALGEAAWMNSVRAEDRDHLEAAWRRLVEDKVTVSIEFRFKHCKQHGDHTIDTWVLLSAFPEKNADGSLKSIFGCITDISSPKWAEKVQNERREEAVELKRQQENFIDITSHEMRNPLSAILQCADQIANNITDFKMLDNKAEVESLLENCLDAANTINLCASHQKRIVDDVLTLSKLDSNLLTVAPTEEKPVRVVQRTLKMFEAELGAHDIEFEFLVDDSFVRHGIKRARLDPSRLSQILINLMTNAIKFTQGQEKRVITVKLSASRDISEVASQGVSYLPRHNNQLAAGIDLNNKAEWGSGDVFNIHCSVEDSGPGLEEEDLKILFQRFQQASPRTHVQYGGSGLGLFISRILTEMQGGQIGVASSTGQGSKFSFYIQCRKCEESTEEVEDISAFKIPRKCGTMDPAMTTIPKLTGEPIARRTSTAQVGPLYDVLIVEDNIVNQKVLQRQLRNCGNNTVVANHGQEALQALEKTRFWAGHEAEGSDISVILMDLEMPVMDGMTCARRIRELERDGTIIRHIPIIAVTAYARPEQIESAKEAGIDDVISKPFRIPELLPKINELVTKYSNLAIDA